MRKPNAEKPPFPKSSIPGLIWPGIPDSNGAMMLAILAQLNESQWWSSQLLERKQMEQLHALVGFAESSVPYYKGLIADEIRAETLDEYLQELPILGRTSVQDNFELLQSSGMPESHGEVSDSATSGSTSIPLKLRHSSMFRVFEGCNVLRQHRWHNFDYSKKLVGISTSVNKAKRAGRKLDAPDQPSWGWPVAAIYPSGPVNGLSIQEPVKIQAEWLKTQRPAYLVSTPSNLRNLAEYCLEHGVTFQNLEKISSTMEIVTEEFRRICREAWNVEVVDNYSCREVGTIASQCPDSSAYHIVSENVIVEILDENGHRCKQGETGRVVVTNLRNFAMPLIRYELSDHAEVGKPCPCGRGLPVLNRILGRTRNMLKLPNGEKRWAGLGRPEIAKLIPVRQFQIVQTALDTIQINLVVSGIVSEDSEQKVRQIIQGRLTYPFNIKFNYVDEIPLGSGGKIEDFVCQV